MLAHLVQTTLIGLQQLIQGAVLSHGESADLTLLYYRVLVPSAALCSKKTRLSRYHLWFLNAATRERFIAQRINHTLMDSRNHVLFFMLS